MAHTCDAVSSVAQPPGRLRPFEGLQTLLYLLLELLPLSDLLLHGFKPLDGGDGVFEQALMAVLFDHLLILLLSSFFLFLVQDELLVKFESHFLLIELSLVVLIFKCLLFFLLLLSFFFVKHEVDHVHDLVNEIGLVIS